ncbi:MAG: hypothetical protein JWO46_1036, partial [Nocardioidaceae bacterium]|nr:hypothetical protein [Nocardioidaceae bacterium]
PAPEHTSGRRGVLAFAATTGTAIAAAAVVAAVDPNQPGHYPTCPFLFVSGLWCPGCGTLRAVHDLAHGDLVGALDRNPLAVALLPCVLFAWVCWGLRLSGRKAPHPTQLRPVVIWSLLAVVLVFWVLRNVPGWTWLSPA